MLHRIFIKVTILFNFSLMVTSLDAQCNDAYIGGLMDGHTTSSTPKFVLICATEDIPDLSIYSLGSANNGSGTTAPGEYTFPDDPLSAGDCVTLATEVPMFLEYFGCNPTYTNGGVVNVNGDDAIELFCNGILIDVYGDVDTDGTGESWEYTDGWAVRLNASTFPNTSFSISDWVVAPNQTPEMHHFNDNGMMTVDCPACDIISISAGTQSACDPVTNTYTQEVIIEYSGGPATGNLVVNNQIFTLTSSPQTVTLSGLDSDGMSVDVSVVFSDLPGCSGTSIDLYTAPDDCLVVPAVCSITNLEIQNVTCNDAGVNADICFDFENPISNNVEIVVDNTVVGSYVYPAVSGGCVSISTDFFVNSTTEVIVRDAASTNPIYISEFHYDNVSTDVGEFIEITAPAGTDLTGFVLSLYNGSNNSEYDNIVLSGIVPGTIGTCGVIAFDTPDLQNGPDAIALVDAAGVVIEFISYEGVLTAIDGPAQGLTSVDVGVSELGTASVSSSISLINGVWTLTDPNSRGALNMGARCIDPCEASMNFEPPLCCSEFVVDVIAICNDSSNPFIEGSYYISIAGITGGQNSGNYDVTIQGVTTLFDGSPIVIGPYSHSGLGNAVQTIEIIEPSTDCSYTQFVTETLCTDIDGIEGPDNDIAYCQCNAASNNPNPGVILSQTKPGTYMAGGTSNKIQTYILSEQGSGTITISAINNTGFFDNLGGNQYFVFAINFDIANSTDLQNDLVVGQDINITTLTDNAAPYDDECYSVCGPAEYSLDCFPTLGSLACNNHLNISVGSTCEVELEPSIFLQGSITVLDNYDLVISDNNNAVVDHNGSTVAETDDIRNYLDQDLTFTITDFCSGNTCWGLVTFEDKIPPVISCDCPVGGEDFDGDGDIDGYADECIFQCYDISLIEGDINGVLPDDISDFINNNIEDNCYEYSVDDVSFEDDLKDLGPCAGSLLRRTWTIDFEDINRPGSSNAVSCTREYLFQPIDITAIDTADGSRALKDILYMPVYQTVTSCELGTDPEDIRRNEGVEFAYPHIVINNRAFPINENLCNLSVTYTDDKFPGCGATCNGNRKVIRNWSILDWCTSELVRYRQVIKAEDTTPPLIILGDDISQKVDGNSCTATVALPAPITLGDFCEGVVSYYIEGSSGDFSMSGNGTDGFILSGVTTGNNEIYYAAEDCCGNIGRDTLTITIVDSNRPNCIAVERVTVGLHEFDLTGTGDQLGLVSALSVDNGSFDFCSDVTLELRRVTDNCNDDNEVFGEKVSFCCEDMDADGFADIEVELRVTDDSGNDCVVRSKIILKDNSRDVITCPDGIVIDCLTDISDLSVTGLPTSNGICGSVNLDLDEADIVDNTVPTQKPSNVSPTYDADGNGTADVIPPYDEACGYGALRRSFFDGNQLICEQYFVVTPVDPFNPNNIVWPSDMETDCGVVDPGSPSFTKSPCGKTGFTVEVDTIRNVDHACYKIFNTHTVIDWCAYEQSNGMSGIYTHRQVITVLDDQAPLISAEDNLEFAITSGCTAPMISLSALATDNVNCNNDILNWRIEVDYFSDGFVDVRESNTSVSGDSLFTILSNVPASKSGHSIKYIVVDACENATESTYSFIVVDKKSPTPYCINVATTTMDNGSVEIWARDLNLGSSDNCTGSESLRYTFSEVAPPSNDGFYNSENGFVSDAASFNASEADRWDADLFTSGRVISALDINADGLVALNVYVWDECGNYDFCAVQLSVVDNNAESIAAISGRIYTEYGEAVQSVDAQLLNGSNANQVTIKTNDRGEYAFLENTVYKQYQVNGEKNDDYLNGVSTFDLILIQKHILNDELLDSPYKMIAADVSNDNVITAIDLIQLRKVILGVHDEFPDNGSWKFVDESDDLDISQPWRYSEDITIDNLIDDRIDQDFIAVKIGDVNNSMVPNVVSQASELRNINYIEFRYKDAYIESGSEATIGLTTNCSELFGYQFSFVTDGLDIINCSGRDMYDENYHLIDKSGMTISHNTGYPISNASEVLSITVKAKHSGWISDMIEINSDYIRSEAYVGTELDIQSIVLKEDSEVQFDLFQNEPNPFSHRTTIGFELPDNGDVTFSLFDVSGQLIKSMNVEGSRGYNEITLNKEDIGVTGLIYYKIESRGLTATKHMILIE